MSGKLGLNVQVAQAGLVDAITPVLAIVSADVDAMLAEGLAAFAGKNVVLWRPANRDPRLCLRPAGQGGLPYRAKYQLGNEFDDNGSALGPDGWGRAFVTYQQQVRPDLEAWYGGPPTYAPQYGDSDLLAMCAGVVLHVGIGLDENGVQVVYPDLAHQFTEGKPVMLGEVELPLDQPDVWPRLVDGAIEALAMYGAPYAFLWGASQTQADAITNLNGIDFRGQVAAYNTNQGDTTVADAKTEPEQEQEIQTNFAQVSDLTEALRRIRQGKWTGADGVDGMIVALQGGKPLDFTPSFP